MSKLKTHSGTKKRFRTTANNKIKRSHAKMRHGLRKRSSDMKRAAAHSAVMNASDAKIIHKFFIPYGLK